MKVLLATDGSVHASTAMLTSSRLLRSRDVEADFLTVSAAIRHSDRIDKHLHLNYRKLVESRANRIVDDAQRLLARTFLRTNTIVEHGSASAKLLALAENYDLTVVGAYGNHDRKQPGLGPVASRLLQHTRSNVLIGRELANENNYRVLVAIDSSEASLTAIQAMTSLFDSAALEVTVVHVIETSWASPLSTQSQDDDIDTSEIEEYEQQLDRELRQTANTVTENALRELERQSIPANILLKEGEPALEICSEADEGGYDLIVVGAAGTPDVKHALLGSVSLKIAWNSPCSVAVIRRAVE
jgi:nucleotide-binding universal stress UspA family protein